MTNLNQTETTIRQLFVDSGEKERLLQLLRSRLNDAGWNDALGAYCRESVQKKNTDEVTFEDLFQEASEYGRSTIQESIKIDMLKKIKKFMDDHVE